MRYDQISVSRLNITISTLRESHKRLRAQGVLGISEGRCCNHTRVTVAEDEIEVGCLVGLLVGIGNFEVGSCDTAMGLVEDKIKTAFRNAVVNNSIYADWTDLSNDDRVAYRGLLAGLQNLHDSSPRFGINGTEFVLFVLVAMIARFEAVRESAHAASASTVEWTKFGINMGDHYENPNATIVKLHERIEHFIAKK